MKKRPRFFCDNCNSEVLNEDKSCKGCGLSFSSIRCPTCGFSGEESLFLRGCPSCGYSAPPEEKVPRKKKTHQTGQPPAWVYVFCGLLLLVAFVFIAFAITR